MDVNLVEIFDPRYIVSAANAAFLWFLFHFVSDKSPINTQRTNNYLNVEPIHPC